MGSWEKSFKKSVRLTLPWNRPKAVPRKHEQEKKRQYNRRVMEVEHGSFTPLVFTTTGDESRMLHFPQISCRENLTEKRR